MFDVLVYLYETYGGLAACPDPDALTRKLASAGFEEDEITEAIGWLQGLAQVSEQSVTVATETTGAFRVFAEFEQRRLGQDAVAFLAFLESAGQLTSTQREIVIERALAVAESSIPLDKLKVIVLMVLWSQQADTDILLLEELLDDGEDRQVH